MLPAQVDEYLYAVVSKHMKAFEAYLAATLVVSMIARSTLSVMCSDIILQDNAAITLSQDTKTDELDPQVPREVLGDSVDQQETACDNIPSRHQYDAFHVCSSHVDARFGGG